MPDIYDELGVKKYINAAGTYTAVGGSKMSAGTIASIKEAASYFVDIKQLSNSIGEKIAKLTKNEAAYVCNSCSTAIFLCVSACVEKKAGKPYAALDKEYIESCNVIALASHHIPYDRAITQAGVRLNFIGYANPNSMLDESELINAITDKTVCLYYYSHTPLGYSGDGIIGLTDFIRIGKEYNVPVLVDAAAQLPPKSNLWEFTKLGADMVVFSGGKDLRGPQASGLALGKKEYIERVSALGFPNYGIGRIMKIGREEMIALYNAVKEYVNNDEELRLDWCEIQVNKICSALEKSSIFEARRTWPNQAGQPLPRCFVEIKKNVDITGTQLCKMLKSCDPGIFCFTENQNGVYINPMCLEEFEIEYIIDQLLRIEMEIANNDRG